MRRKSAPVISPIPAWIGGLGALAFAYLVVPLVLMGMRVPWGRLPELLTSEAALAALALSVKTALVALALDLLFGVPAAILLSRTWRGVGTVRILVALPLSLPPVVAGMALIAAFGRRGIIGSFLESFGVSIAFSWVAVVMAQVFVSLPFLIVTLEAALRTRPEGLEEMAASLGASPTRVLFSITLPQVVPGLARGSALALARCLGEFGATLTFAGSLQGVTRTLPLQIYLARESDTDLALALGVVLLFAAALVVGVTETIGVRRPAPIPSEEDSLDAVGGDCVFGGSSGAPASPSASPIGEKGPLARLDPLEVAVRGRIAVRGWDVDCVLPAGIVTAVMGPNGSGKSTLAGVISGSILLDEGEAHIGRTLVNGEGVFVPARKRAVALVSQRPCLFGWMSVLDNVAFPLVARHVPKREAKAAALEQLRAVGLESFADRRADALSGGQAARVAIARALVFDPDVLILDEPTASLDVEASARVAAVVARRLAGERITVLLITHDLVETLALASRLLVIEDGRIVESGEPARIVAEPTSLFAARLAGLNVVTGEALIPDPASGMVSVDVKAGLLTACAGCAEGLELTGECFTSTRRGALELKGIVEGAPVALLFSPDAVALSREAAEGSPRTVLRGRVLSVEDSKGVLSVRVDLDGAAIMARLTAGAWAELALSIGDEVWCAIKAIQVRVVPLSRS